MCQQSWGVQLADGCAAAEAGLLVKAAASVSCTLPAEVQQRLARGLHERICTEHRHHEWQRMVMPHSSIKNVWQAGTQALVSTQQMTAGDLQAKTSQRWACDKKAIKSEQQDVRAWLEIHTLARSVQVHSN